MKWREGSSAKSIAWPFRGCSLRHRFKQGRPGCVLGVWLVALSDGGQQGGTERERERVCVCM
jgi:hypothetical protein